MVKRYLLASDFDQTLSFNDSGVVLSELIGFHGFHDKVKGLAEINLVQQGAELSYLILHDPDSRHVRREHLIETGKRIRLKHDVALFARALDTLGEGYKFHFNVISAAPQEIIQSALEGIVPPDHIFGTRFRYNDAGEVASIIRASAGWGKITVLEELRAKLGISHDQIIYMRSEEHTSELQSRSDLVCRLLLEKKKTFSRRISTTCTNTSTDTP